MFIYLCLCLFCVIMYTYSCVYPFLCLDIFTCLCILCGYPSYISVLIVLDSILVCVCVCSLLYIYLFLVCLYLYLYLYICVFMYVCIFIFIYIYICIYVLLRVHLYTNLPCILISFSTLLSLTSYPSPSLFLAWRMLVPFLYFCISHLTLGISISSFLPCLFLSVYVERTILHIFFTSH